MGLPDITVAQFEYLDAVARHPTWAAAASSLRVSPSALSQGLAELERRLGVTLFEREGRRRVPTAAHAEVLRHARQVLAQTHDIVAWAEHVRVGQKGRVRLGMIDVGVVAHFPKVLRRYRAERPGLEVHLTVASSASLLTEVAGGNLDLVVCVAPPTSFAGVALTPLWDENLFVYPTRDASGDDEPWGPWVTFPAGSHTRTIVEREVRALRRPFDVVAESNQPEVLREMVRLGLGCTVLPAAQAGIGTARLAARSGNPLCARTLVLARRTTAAAIPAVDELATLLLATPITRSE